jgi:hypothetical protein
VYAPRSSASREERPHKIKEVLRIHNAVAVEVAGAIDVRVAVEEVVNESIEIL